MAASASSIGSRTSFSTTSGEPPGYTAATVTYGGATSGYSSVLRVISAKLPKITRASIATTVIVGRRIEKSDISIAVS